MGDPVDNEVSFLTASLYGRPVPLFSPFLLHKVPSLASNAFLSLPAFMRKVSEKRGLLSLGYDTGKQGPQWAWHVPMGLRPLGKDS